MLAFKEGGLAMNKQDRRVKRTKKDLRDAFLSLTKQKDIAQITVKEIIEKADYNRTTFYVHYADKLDLMDDFMKVNIAGIIEAIRTPYRENKSIDLSTIQDNALLFIDYIYENQQTFEILFNKQHFFSFEEELTKAILQINLEDVFIDDPIFENIDKEIYFRMHTKALIGLIEYWIHSDFSKDINFIKTQLINFWKVRNTLIQFK